MKKSILSVFIGVLLAFLLSVSLVNAVQSFSVNPTSISDTVSLGASDSTTLVVTNTGDEPLNLTLSEVDASSGSNVVDLVLDTTTITNLAPSGTANVVVSYNPSGIPVGNYVGSVTLTSDTNSSVTSNVPVTIVVEATAGPQLIIVNESDNRVEMEGDLDRKKRRTITVLNSGNVTLTDIKFVFEDLKGDDDEIPDNDIEIGDSDEDGFDLDPGESEDVRITVDVPRGIDIDTYVGDFTLETAENFDFDFELEFEVTGGDLEVEFAGFFASGDTYRIEGEAGETISDIEIDVDNVGDVDAFGITVEVKDDLDEEFSSETFSKNFITFSPSSFDLEEGEEDTLDIDIEIPEDTEDGTYFGELRILDANGKELDEITLELKVTGDVFIKEIKGIDQTYEPGDSVDIEVVLRNQGSQVQRSVQVTGTLFDVDFGNTDITESSRSFILDINKEHTEVLRFNLPDDVEDGSHTLELRIDFDDGTLVELEEIVIRRADKNLVINSHGINPGVAKCEDTVFAFTRIENLGRFDEKIKVVTEITGQGISDETSLFELEVDENFQENSNLDISRLEPGTYEIAHRVEFTGGFEKKESLLRIVECSDSIPGVVIDDTGGEDNVTTTNNTTSDNVFNFGETEVAKNTVYLGGAIGLVFVLILISLFFL